MQLDRRECGGSIPPFGRADRREGWPAGGIYGAAGAILADSGERKFKRRMRPKSIIPG